MELSQRERYLLKWLGESDVSQYGECNGAALDTLVANGLAVVLGEETEIANPFIGNGRGIMYRAVKLTEAGRALLDRR